MVSCDDWKVCYILQFFLHYLCIFPMVEIHIVIWHQLIFIQCMHVYQAGLCNWSVFPCPHCFQRRRYVTVYCLHHTYSMYILSFKIRYIRSLVTTIGKVQNWKKTLKELSQGISFPIQLLCSPSQTPMRRTAVYIQYVCYCIQSRNLHSKYCLPHSKYDWPPPLKN